MFRLNGGKNVCKQSSLLLDNQDGDQPNMLAAKLLWEVLKRNEKLEGEGKIENVQSYSRCTSDISTAYGEKWMSTIMERVEMVSIWKAAYEEWDQGKAGLLIDKCEEKYSWFMTQPVYLWVSTETPQLISHHGYKI